MTLSIPDTVLQDINLSSLELRLEIAVYLYEKKRLSIGKARQLAGMDLISFQKALAARNIYIHYDENDLKSDLQNIGDIK